MSSQPHRAYFSLYKYGTLYNIYTLTNNYNHTSNKYIIYYTCIFVKMYSMKNAKHK